MAWIIEFDPAAVKELSKLDPQVARRILLFLQNRVASLDDPRAIGEALTGPHLGMYWKYRVGDYRVVTHIQDKAVQILVIKVGDRQEVYQ